MRAPSVIIPHSSDRELNLKSIMYKSDQLEVEYTKLFYTFAGSKHRVVLRPEDVETDFSKKGRPEPTGLIQQGKYDCAAASLAMLLGCSLYDVKQAMAFCGWRNDNRGASNDVLLQATKLLGRELEWTDTPTGKPCLVTVKSLNLTGRYHAVCWDGKQIIDPNFGNKSRFYWGPEWAPWTIGSSDFYVLKDNKTTETDRDSKALYFLQKHRRNKGVFCEL